MAEAGDKYYRAMTPTQIEDARKGTWRIRVTPTKAVPRDWFGVLEGKSVLCLAGGGGQQSPILAALGADVTVFDVSDSQLARDQKIAEREGLVIQTLQGDMRDLAEIDDESFDLIVSPCATCFCPTVEEVWRESFRVLKPGGSLIVGFINPIYYLFDAAKMDRDEFQVSHSIPYCDFDLPDKEREQLIGPDRPLEFGHSLDSLLGKQIAAGFKLTGFFEDGWGASDKLSSLINLFIATRATK
ncbi:MAG: SAM-dependent methyltransferase [Mariniblastus sp.]|jgi:SAM-dependent methyltransferase